MLTNLENIAKLIGTFSGTVDDRAAEFLSKTIVNNWHHYLGKVAPSREDFILFQERIIIPYGKGKAALLPLKPGVLVTFIDFDFDNPPSDLKEVAEKISLARKAVSLTDALAQWTKSGFKLATEEQYAERKKICEGCNMWDGEGYLGMGQCKKCGCSGAKLRFATSKCPLDKWGKIV